MYRTAVIMLLASLAGTVWAAPDDNRFAFVMGNAAYDGEAALANAANDASDVAEALGNIGWKVTKLINGDRKAMNRTLQDFRDAMSKAENPVALFYYAGHGVQINGQNYLIPLHEAFETPDDIITDALSLNTVQTAFDDAKVSVDIFILDACRDNPFAKKNSRSLNGTRGLTVVNKSASVEGTAVMFSTAPGETAADGTGRNGTFTQVLLKYLDSDLKLQDLATKVTKDVKTLTGGKQTPYNSLSLSDDFYLVPASMRKTLTPSSSASSNISGAQVALLGQRSALVAKRKTLLSGPSPLGWLTWAGLAGSAAGVGASVWGYLSVQQAKAAYATATGLTDLTARQLGWDAARATKDLGNILFSGGIALAVGGLGALVVPFFTGPDTASIDQKIAEIDRTMAGANQ